MNGKILTLFIIFVIFSSLYFVSADFGLSVEKVDKGAVIISELNNPAVYEFFINNPDGDDMAEIYSLVSVSMAPKGTFLIPAGESKLEVRAYPGKEYRRAEGVYTFEYQIKGVQKGIFKDKLTFRVVPLKDALSVKDVSINRDDNSAEVTVKNNINSYLENVDIYLSSAFFDSIQTINLKPFEEIKLSVKVNKEKISSLAAGQYSMDAEVKIEDVSVVFKANINYLEKKDISETKKYSGIIVRTTTFAKSNDGNIPVTADIVMTKDIFSRLFTTFSIEPMKTERKGLIVNYDWQRDIGPNEVFTVNSTTNYTFPFLLVILVVVVGYLVRAYTTTALVLNKRVSFVRTKGGEFALKVIINVKAKKHLDNIQIVDRLPMMAKLYEKFGRHPDRIDEASRRLFWDIPRLNKGEERIFSYILYSKVRAVGRFELPPALAVFERDGEQHEVVSNRAYFVSETNEE